MGVGEDEARRIAALFAIGGAPGPVEPFGGGHINDSWRLAAPDGRRFLLQRLNGRVFPEPRRVMENVVRVTRHLGGPLRLVPTEAGTDWHDEGGATWRLFHFIERSTAFPVAADPARAYAAAHAFGDFQRRLATLPGPPLHETIPGFHDTPARVVALERAASVDRAGRRAGVAPELAALLSPERRRLGRALEDARVSGVCRERIVHNDAKIANVLFDESGSAAVCVVDLDTAMPGIALHDYGDLARSTASASGEDAPPEEVSVRLEYLDALTAGFLEGTGGLSAAERALLPVAARVITYEQAVRFLADHLDGDRYFRIERPGQNLERCRTQIALLEGLERGA